MGSNSGQPPSQFSAKFAKAFHCRVQNTLNWGSKNLNVMPKRSQGFLVPAAGPCHNDMSLPPPPPPKGISFSESSVAKLSLCTLMSRPTGSNFNMIAVVLAVLRKTTTTLVESLSRYALKPT